MSSPSHVDTSALFRHVTAERADLYRAIMDVFALAKRQFRLHLRPDEVRHEARWPEARVPTIEQVQQALSQLTEWGNLNDQPDTGRVASIEDFYRARFLYRLSEPGEAVETAMAAFVQALGRRAELQSVALEDILSRLETLLVLSRALPLDGVKVHETLRDLIAVFTSLADNAQAFMAAVARTIDLQNADASALMGYKKRLIDYLERFIGDLVARSSSIAQHLEELADHAESLLSAAAAREARDAAPGDELANTEVVATKLSAWRERWAGLNMWFRRTGHAAKPCRAPASARTQRDTAAVGGAVRAERAAQRQERSLRGLPHARALVRAVRVGRAGTSPVSSCIRAESSAAPRAVRARRARQRKHAVGRCARHHDPSEAARARHAGPARSAAASAGSQP